MASSLTQQKCVAPFSFSGHSATKFLQLELGQPTSSAYSLYATAAAAAPFLPPTLFTLNASTVSSTSRAVFVESQAANTSQFITHLVNATEKRGESPDALPRGTFDALRAVGGAAAAPSAFTPCRPSAIVAHRRLHAHNGGGIPAPSMSVASTEMCSTAPKVMCLVTPSSVQTVTSSTVDSNNYDNSESGSSSSQGIEAKDGTSTAQSSASTDPLFLAMPKPIAADVASVCPAGTAAVVVGGAPIYAASSSAALDGGAQSDGCSASGRKRKDLVRDDAYWERRRKNNDAAKRSRDTRRKKEDDVAIRAAILEQENLRLRFEIERLKSEIERHRIIATVGDKPFNNNNGDNNNNNNNNNTAAVDNNKNNNNDEDCINNNAIVAKKSTTKIVLIDDGCEKAQFQQPQRLQEPEFLRLDETPHDIIRQHIILRHLQV